MKYTAEEVRAIAKRLHDDITVADGDALMASDMLTAYAERIKAAQVDPAAKPRTLADFVHATDAERVQIGQQVAARVDEMMAEPVAPGEPVAWSLVFSERIGVNASTTFRTEKQANDYADKCAVPDACDPNPTRPRVVALYTAPPIDFAAVREVIAALRSVEQDHHDAWADKLNAALPESKP